LYNKSVPNLLKAGDDMKYVNGMEVFPSELLELLQDYVQGQYVYIPKRDKSKEKWGAKTTYRKELDMRNSHIYTKYLTGLSVKQLVEKYHLSEKSIKRILFDKRKEAGIMKEEIETLLEAWGIKEEIKQIYDTAWSVGDNYVMKTNQNLAGLRRNVEMMKILEECGIPVAKPIPTLAGQDYIETKGEYFLLMNKLSGTHILDIYQADYVNIAYETGRAVAKLHTAFLTCEQKITFWNNNLVEEMTGWVGDTLQANRYRYITKIDYEESLKELQACYDKLPRQLIHRDMHYGNLLFHKGTFSGYIDFDLSQKNVRIFDICYFLIGLLIDHEKKKEDMNKWFEIVSNFIRGYETINKLTDLEKDSIVYLMKNIELLFVAYFIGEEDEILAESSAGLYYFVKEHEDVIRSAINC
jgi:Ser/Thr protein kinase RdoA (MazF antagonist)